MTYLIRMDKIIARLESGLLIFMLLLMICLAFSQVILRNFFSTGIEWADVFIRHLLLWICFLGASLGTRENRHITIDVFSQIASPYYKRIISIITNFVAGSVCLILVKASYDFLQAERIYGGNVFLSVPVWITQLIIPIGFCIIAFRFYLAIFQPSENSIPKEEK